MNQILLKSFTKMFVWKPTLQKTNLQIRTFKNFGHRKGIPQPNSMAMRVFVCIGMFGAIFNWEIVGDWIRKVKALEIRNEDEQKNDNKGAKKRLGFRDRKIIEYENRIREYSSPDKIFRYFATIKISFSESSEAYMTPDDFLRSIMPGLKQPDASKRHFRIAFKMMDLNGDGNVDAEEFEKITSLFRQQNAFGNRYRDHANATRGINSGLVSYFFGPDKKKKLSIDEFLKFQEQLQHEILSLEFQLKNPNEHNMITEHDFSELLLAYAGFPDKKRLKILKRIKKKYRDQSLGISKQDYLDFFRFLNNINDIDIALTLYHISGAEIDHFTMKHVAKAVAQVDLRDHVINVVFALFDENQDGRLSNTEFVMIMKRRLLRGIIKQKDSGFFNSMYSFVKSAKNHIISEYFPDY